MLFTFVGRSAILLYGRFADANCLRHPGIVDTGIHRKNSLTAGQSGHG